MKTLIFLFLITLGVVRGSTSTPGVEYGHPCATEVGCYPNSDLS